MIQKTNVNGNSYGAKVIYFVNFIGEKVKNQVIISLPPHRYTFLPSILSTAFRNSADTGTFSFLLKS